MNETIELWKKLEQLSAEIKELENEICDKRKSINKLMNATGVHKNGIGNIKFDYTQLPRFIERLKSVKSFAELGRDFSVLSKTARNWIYQFDLIDIAKKNPSLKKKIELNPYYGY